MTGYHGYRGKENDPVKKNGDELSSKENDVANGDSNRGKENDLSQTENPQQAEMPTSGDLKSGDCLFFYSPSGISTTPPPPPPRKIDPAPNGNDLGHYMTSYMTYILSEFEC